MSAEIEDFDNLGYVKIYRKMLRWEWYSDVSVKTLFFHCLLNARHYPTKWRGKNFKQGQFPTGFAKMAKETGLSIKQVRTALEKLEKTGEVARESTNSGTILTVINYGTYHGCDDDKGKQKGKQGANEGQTKGKQRATIKESIERKESKEGKKTRHLDYVFLTKAEHLKLIESFGEKGAEERIWNLNDYGHRMNKKFKQYTDHYRVILSWERRNGTGVKKAERKLVH